MEGIFMCIVAIFIQLDTLLTQGQINLALNKECRHSSKIGPAIRFLPGCAVDGNREQHIAQGAACSHTALFEPFNWWTVDLGQQYTVDTITIYKRADSCCDRLADYDVLVYSPVISTWEDYNKSAPDLCYHHDGISPLVINITCPTGTIGRYVQIYKQNGVDFNITESPLTLCELEVYGPRNLTDTEDTVIDTTSRTSLSTYAEDTVIKTTTGNSLRTDAEATVIKTTRGNYISTDAEDTVIKTTTGNSLRTDAQDTVVKTTTGNSISTDAEDTVIETTTGNSLRTDAEVTMIKTTTGNSLRTNAQDTVVKTTTGNSISTDAEDTVIETTTGNSLSTDAEVTVIKTTTGHSLSTDAEDTVIKTTTGNSLSTDAEDIVIETITGNSLSTDAEDTVIKTTTGNSLSTDAEDTVIKTTTGNSLSTDAEDTVIETATRNSLSTDVLKLNQSICQCLCKSSTFAWSSNYTKEELQVIMSEELEILKRELRVRRSILTSSLRKLNSAGDNRTSSKSIGITAAIFLICVVCFIILLDLIKLKENIKVKRKKFKTKFLNKSIQQTNL